MVICKRQIISMKIRTIYFCSLGNDSLIIIMMLLSLNIVSVLTVLV